LRIVDLVSLVKVFVSMHPTPDDVLPLVAKRRCDALQALRDELVGLEGLLVSTTPREAEVQVEITDILGVDEGPMLRSARRSQRIADAHRVLIVRLIDEGETLDLVCGDRSGNTAEHQVATRVHAWTKRKHDAAARPA
jgi:hypothetical protein